MNGASEATLQELLAVNKSMAQAIGQLAAKGGGGGSGAGGAGPAPAGPGLFSKALDGAGSAAKGLASLFTGTLGVAAGLVGAGFSQVAATGMAVFKAQKQLSESAIEGSGKLSSFSDSLSQMPGILGMIASAYSFQIKKQEANLRTYQAISDSGAMLGGSLSEVRKSAMATGLSMSEFGEMMKANSGVFLRMGGTAEDGAAAMIKFNKAMVNGDTGRKIMNLGFNAQQANNLLGVYAETMGGISASQLADQKGMEKSVKDFATELTLSAALEGVTREEKMKQMKEDAKNGARNNMLAQMSEKDRTAYLQAEDRARAIGGKGAADALLSLRLGLPPMTKEAQKFTAIQGEASKEVQNLNNISKDSALSAEERDKKMDQATAKGQKSVADSAKKYGQTAVALAMQGDSTMNAALNASAKATNQGTKTEEDYQKNIEKTRAQVKATMEKSGKDSAGATEQAAMRAKYQEGIMGKINEILARFFPIVVKVVDAFMNLFTWSVNMGSKILDKVLLPAFKEIFGGISAAELMKPFKDFWKGLTGGFTSGDIDFTKIKDTIVKFVKPIVDTFMNIVRTFDFEAMGKYVRDGVKAIWDMASGIFNTLDQSGVFTDIVDFFKGFMDGISGLFKIASAALGAVDWKGIGEGLAQVFSKIWNVVKDVLTPVFEKGSMLFAKIGEDMGPLFNDFSDIFKLLLGHVQTVIDMIQTYIVPLIKPVIDGIMNALFPLWDAFKNIVKAIKALLSGDFKSAGTYLADAIGNLWSAVKEFLSGLKEAALKLVNPANWFGGDDKKKAEAKPAASPATNAAQASASAATGNLDKLALDSAWQVYSKQKTLADVPADVKAKVQDILNNPPGNWKDAVNKTQQQNSQQKASDQKPAETKPETKKEEKPAATPAVDLNNKDAVAILKAIADYQRRTVDAVNGLNGNILKRA